MQALRGTFDGCANPSCERPQDCPRDKAGDAVYLGEIEASGNAIEMLAHPNVRDVAINPEWIPHAFEPEGDQLVSVFVPRDAREKLVFLTDGQFRDEYRKVKFPVAAVEAESTRAAQAPLHFIFHTSFCCSTLLARALELPGIADSLREPNILVNVAERLIRADEQEGRSELELAARLLARPFAEGARVVVKPSSFANRLIEPLLTLRPQSRAVLLFSDPATYLRSLVRRGLLGRINGRKLYRNIASWSSVSFGFSVAETFEQTDLQIAGLAWLMQISHFNSLARTFGSERIITLDSAALLQDPMAVLNEVQSFFGLGLTEQRVREVSSGPIFSKHSKFSDLDYDSEARERDHEAVTKAHAEELGMVLQWLNAVAAHLGLPMRP